MPLTVQPVADLPDLSEAGNGVRPDHPSARFRVRIGHDLQVVAAGAKLSVSMGCTVNGWHLQVFDLDGNYLSTVAETVGDPHQVLDAAIRVAALLYPDNLTRRP